MHKVAHRWEPVSLSSLIFCCSDKKHRIRQRTPAQGRLRAAQGGSLQGMSLVPSPKQHQRSAWSARLWQQVQVLEPMELTGERGANHATAWEGRNGRKGGSMILQIGVPTMCLPPFKVPRLRGKPRAGQGSSLLSAATAGF